MNELVIKEPLIMPGQKARYYGLIVTVGSVHSCAGERQYLTTDKGGTVVLASVDDLKPFRKGEIQSDEQT